MVKRKTSLDFLGAFFIKEKGAKNSPLPKTCSTTQKIIHKN